MELGLWRDSRYLARKSLVTLEDDPRELIPLCVVNVSSIQGYTVTLTLTLCKVSVLIIYYACITVRQSLTISDHEAL